MVNTAGIRLVVQRGVRVRISLLVKYSRGRKSVIGWISATGCGSMKSRRRTGYKLGHLYIGVSLEPLIFLKGKGMGLTINIVGIKPANKKWKEMKAVYDTCVTANIPIPEEVVDFFEGEIPLDDGMEVPLVSHMEYGDTEDYYTIDLEGLPKGVTSIRVWARF